MSETTINGGCFCGAVRLHIFGPAHVAAHCHCTDCQKFTGSGHASGMIFATQDIRTVGETTQFRYTADSGNTITRHFCPRCGVGLYQTNDAHPETTAVPVGILDDPSLFRPMFSIYGASAQSWDRPDPALPAFARMPPPDAFAESEDPSA